MSLRQLNLNEIIDISTVKINKKDKKEDKMLSYINQVKNPYLYKSKDFIIRIHYNENTLFLEQIFKEYIQNL